MRGDVRDALNTILEAHGGVAYWESLAAIEVSMSAWGFLFAAKRIRPLRHAVIDVDTHDPRVVMKDFPASGCTTALLGTRRVETRDASGKVLRYRDNPRAAFGFGRRSLYWDHLDFAYFSGYAMWCYLTLPFLLLYRGVSIENLARGDDGSTILTVRFPDYLPSHSPVQTLYFDPSGRLVRHDYTAEVVGGWAKAAHLCEDYREFGGLWLPTRRRVYPRGPSGSPLPGPLLVGIDIHDARPVPRG